MMSRVHLPPSLSRRVAASQIVAIAAILCLGVPSAMAASFEYAIRNQKSQTDGDPPTLVLKATDIIKGGKVSYSVDSGSTKSISLGKMNPGKEKLIPLKVGSGTHSIKVEIEARGLGDESATIPLQFEVTRVDPIALTIDRDKVDTTNGQLAFEVNRPLDRVEMEIFDADGTQIGTHSQSFGGRYGGLTLNWPVRGEVGGIQIKAHDVDGFWTSVLLEPWWIEIEHEEIIFDFGKASWQPSEEPKLKKSLAEIRTAMKRHAKHRPDMRLYVAGYTDTVGSASQNKELSEKRARAISAWFQKHGVDMPVYYQGFGESVLAVKTDDETPNEQNRRALYVLGNAPPPQSAQMPRANWRKR